MQESGLPLCPLLDVDGLDARLYRQIIAHGLAQEHSGIILCTLGDDARELAVWIHTALQRDNQVGQLVEAFKA